MIHCLVEGCRMPNGEFEIKTDVGFFCRPFVLNASFLTVYAIISALSLLVNQ